MRLLREHSRRRVDDFIIRGVGGLPLMCDTLDDMWLVYGLLQVKDRLSSSTLRKVAVGSQAASTERVRLSLEIVVADLLFDPEQAEIRASGVVCSECEHVRMGAYHTLELALRQPFTLHKEDWDEGMLAPLLRALAAGSAGGGVELIALMLEAGSAQVCSVSPGLTLVRSKVEGSIPKKRSGLGEGKQAEATGRFFEDVLAALVRATDWERTGGGGSSSGDSSEGGQEAARQGPPPLLIASPGSLKDEFRAFLAQAAHSRPAELKGLARAVVLTASAAAGSRWALDAVLAEPRLAAQLGSMAASGEVAAMHAWQALLAREPERAQYGWRHCAAAAERGAVEQLLVSDRLTRSGSKGARGEVARLMDRVRASKGRVAVLSSMHASGEALCGMGGIVAALRYVVHDLDEVAAEQGAGPGVRVQGEGGGEGALAAGGGGGGGSSSSSGSSAPGHRLQEAPVSAPGAGRGKQDRFGKAFDTDSDRSEDSDA